jgi:isoleucyl-tRNA synthetase
MERFSREVVSAIQQARKDTGLDVTDRIELQIHTKDFFVIESIKQHESYIMNETLSLNLTIKEIDGKSEILNKKIDIVINKLANNS